jgi:hypothetical protein
VARGDLVSYLEQFAGHHRIDVRTGTGPVDDVIEVLGSVLMSMGGDPEWIIRMLWTLLVEQGRVEEALPVTDDLAAQAGHTWIELYFERIWLLAHCGRIEQAITELRTHPEAHAWYVAGHPANLLANAGRLDDAIAVLWPTRGIPTNGTSRAKLLIRQGRVREASRFCTNPGWSPVRREPLSLLNELMRVGQPGTTNPSHHRIGPNRRRTRSTRQGQWPRPVRRPVRRVGAPQR